MKRPIRYVITLLLMLCFCISALLYLFLDIAQLDFKLAAKDNMEQSAHLQTIKLSAQEFHNSKKDELWNNGRLYDVRSYIIVNDTVIISVYQDDNEATLIKSIAASFEPADNITPDNFVHITKHRVHAVGGGKILVPPYRIARTGHTDVHFLLPHLVQYDVTAYFAVIKPPPRLSFIITA